MSPCAAASTPSRSTSKTTDLARRQNLLAPPTNKSTLDGDSWSTVCYCHVHAPAGPNGGDAVASCRFMNLQCPHCSRTNSADARFCYFDGAALLGSSLPVETARRTFLAPFVFPTGVACNNYDEFVAGCQRHWDEAVNLLQQ